MTAERSPTTAGRSGAEAEREPRHVVFVLAGLTMGGAEAQLATILEADPERLRRTRAEILTMTPERNELVVERMRALGLEIHLVDRTRLSFPAFFADLVRFFRERRPDVVHTFLAGSTGTWGRLAARAAGVPHVLHSDLSLDPVRTRSQRLLDPLANRLTDRFLPNATAIAERLARQGAARERIRVVRNGVDLSRFDPERATSLRAAWGVPEDAVVAGFLGMFRPVKRPDLLLDAILALPAERRPDHVVMAGDGAMMPEMRRRVEGDAWLRERCRLVGVTGDTPSFLKSIDFLVLTSDTEGLPNAVLEAMAMGRPVVATAVSDVPALVGAAGETVGPGDAGALAEAIARMTARTPEERSELGERGRRRARAEFGLEAAAERFWDAHGNFGDGPSGRAAAAEERSIAAVAAGTGSRPDLALFLPSLAGGGAERVMLELARTLVARGLRIQLILAAGGGDYGDEVPAGVERIDLGAGRVAASLPALVRRLRRDRPRVLLSTLEHANVVAILAARAAPGVRVAIREANTATDDMASGDARGRVLLRAMRALYPRADVVVAPSRGVARELRERLGVPEERLSVIPNPTLPDRVLAAAGRRPDHPWFAPGAPPVVLGVGRLSEQKDFATLLRAFARVREALPARLVILGEGEERDDLLALARQLGVAEDVDLPGFAPDPFPYMAAAGAFVLSSRWEGLPNALIQAMGLGAPVVATDCRSGPREITDDGSLGRLVPVGDAVAMGDAILGALGQERRPPPDAWVRRYRPAAVGQRYLEALSLEAPVPENGEDRHE